MNHRSHISLSLLTAAASRAIELGLLDPGAPNRDPSDTRKSVLFDAVLGSIPLRVQMGEWRLDELQFAVAAWPTEEVDKWVGGFGARDLAGEATAMGYLTRFSDGRLRFSNPFEPTVFIRRNRVAELRAIPKPSNRSDPLGLYPPHLTYDAAA